jgi:hypothetical protein
VYFVNMRLLRTCELRFTDLIRHMLPQDTFEHIRTRILTVTKKIKLKRLKKAHALFPPQPTPPLESRTKKWVRTLDTIRGTHGMNI